MFLRTLMVLAVMIVAGCGGRQDFGPGKKIEISPRIQFSGGSGESYEDAVKITGVEKQSEGLDAEYKFISDKHGVKNRDWTVAGQTIIKEEKGIFDVIEIRLGSDSDRRIYYFDVSSFPWKRK